MRPDRYSIRVLTALAGLAMAGCEQPRDDVVAAEPAPLAPEVSQADSRSSDSQVDREAPAPPVTGKAQTRVPLDLSMPPQTDPGPEVEGEADFTETPLLPDLIGQGTAADRKDAMRLKGTVLMPQALPQSGEQALDSVEGGRVTIEMKTR